MNKVSANLSISLWCDCPHCDEQIELLDTYENEEGDVISLVFDGRFVHDKDQWKDIGMDIKCPKCKKTFIFDKIEW